MPSPSIDNDRARDGSSHRAALQVERAGQCVTISPPDDVEVVPCLFSVRHVAVPDPAHGYRIDKLPYPLCSLTQDCWGDDVLAVPAGLASTVVEELQRTGRQLQGDLQTEPFPARDRQRLDSVQPIDEQLLDFIERHERGIIQYRPRRVSSGKLIAQVARAWPRHTIVVLTTRIADGQRLRCEIGRYSPLVELYSSRHGDTYRSPRIAITTYQHAHATAVHRRQRQIAFAADPVEMLTREEGRAAFYSLWRARCYGLLEEGTTLAPFDRDQLLAVFGQPRILIPAHGRVPRFPTVVFSPIRGGPRLNPGLDALEVKRQGIWAHPLRNRRIVRLARALDAGNRATLRRQFPDVAAAVRRRRRRLRVGILVEVVEHALALAAQLDWPILADPNAYAGGLDENQAGRLEQYADAAPTGGPAIVTYAGLHDAGRFSVLIRADGGPNYNARIVKSAGLLVDFADEHHPLLRQWSRQRREHYEVGDWAGGPLGRPATP